MKYIGVVLICASLAIGSIQIITALSANNQYNQEIKNYWDLADKSSTIEAKSEYINKFVLALENAHLEGMNNAVIYKNLNNSFDANFSALKTLQGRLEQIKTMNPSSFEYQQAIAQITAQEQGEAEDMLSVLGGCWLLKNHILLWWFPLILVGWILLGAFGMFLIAKDNY